MKISRAIKGAALLIVISAALAACKPTPDTEIIKQKGNLDQVVENNKSGGTEKELKDSVAAPGKAVFDLKADNGLVNIKVDADLIVPQVKQVPVVKVVKSNIEDKDIDTIVKTFFGDSELYPERTIENMSKDELLAEIDKIQKNIEKADKDIKDVMKMKSQGYLDSLQAQVSKAPETVELKPITDLKFTEENFEGINGMAKSYMFSGRGDIGEKTGHLTVQKGDAYCNTTFYVEAKNDEGSIPFFPASQVAFSDGKDAADMDNTCKYGKEEAEELCKEVIKKFGMDKDYSVFSVEDTASELPSKGGTSYDGYYIKFTRNVNGISETNDVYDGTIDKEEITDYPYPYESMNFAVTDDGIINFNWDSPMKQTETTAENVALLPYSDIEKIFKDHAVVKYASATDSLTINISEIRFGLMRVKDKDNKDEFTMVPAWDYIGDLYGRTTIMTINAIDGSILNRSYGY